MTAWAEMFATAEVQVALRLLLLSFLIQGGFRARQEAPRVEGIYIGALDAG
jgi:hypothetical protein